MKVSDPILDATLTLVAEGGVDAIRYREVAQVSGVALGTISYRYPAREDLIRAAFAWFLEQNTATLVASRSRVKIRDLADVAELLVGVLRTDFADKRRRYLAEYELVLYASRDAIVAAALAAWDRQVVTELAGTLEPLGIAQPLAAAQTLVDMFRGFQLANLGRPDRDLDGFGARIQHVLDGLSRSSTSPSNPISRTRSPRIPRIRKGVARVHSRLR
ncbi:MAG: TetR/AcrR family transcriptional regulator [Kofleriaceae bacterium]